jgi:hypothetical protein
MSSHSKKVERLSAGSAHVSNSIDDSTKWHSKRLSEDRTQHLSEDGAAISATPMTAALRDFFEDATGQTIWCNADKATYGNGQAVSTLTEAVEFLKKDWPLETTEATVKINMLSIPTTQRTFFSVRRYPGVS